MPPPLHPDVAALVQDALEAGLSTRAIADAYNLHVTTIRKIRRIVEVAGQPQLPPHCGLRPGAPRALNGHQEQQLLQHLERCPWLYRSEIVDWLDAQFNKRVSEATMTRILQRSDLRKAVGQRRVGVPNAELRAAWIAKSTEWRPEQLVFIDESAFSAKTLYRSRGWSKKGTKVSLLSPTVRGSARRFSVLPAMTINGFLPGTLIKEGSVKSVDFIQWIENTVLPQLPPGSILVMDNASIHRSQYIQDVVARADCIIEYLPPYSPDLMPIEQSFNVLKSWVRRHREQLLDSTDFEAFVTQAVEQAGGIYAAAHMRSCGYIEE